MSGAFLSAPVAGSVVFLDPANASASGGSIDSVPYSGAASGVLSSALTLRPTQAASANGRPVMRVSAASLQKLFETSSALAGLFAGVSSYSWYQYVARTDGGGGANSTFGGAATATGSYLIHGSLGVNKDQVNRTTEAVGSTINNEGGASWAVGTAIYSSRYDGTGYTNALNTTVTQAAAANVRNLGTPTIFALGAYVLGAGSFGGYLTGDLGQLWVFPGVSHSTAQWMQQVNYMRSHYGI